MVKELLISILESLGLAWWVEIVTENPKCTYYFGPFLKEDEAETAKAGYLEDLEQEGATDIRCTVKRDKPSDLTIYEDREGRVANQSSTPVLSGQT